MSWSSLLSNGANWAQLIWATCALMATWFGWYKSRKSSEAKHAVEMALLHKDIKSIVDRMNKEFNGNSGGIRERINSMDDKIDRIEERVDENATDLAKLTGRFDEHTDK